MTTRQIRLVALASMGLALGAVACHNGRNIKATTISSTRFELATGSVVLGAKQLLLDTSNGDVWVLEGAPRSDARWELLARGPEDLREPVATDLLAALVAEDDEDTDE